jgi:hypothetical protein
VLIQGVTRLKHPKKRTFQSAIHKSGLHYLHLERFGPEICFVVSMRQQDLIVGYDSSGIETLAHMYFGLLSCEPLGCRGRAQRSKGGLT